MGTTSPRENMGNSSSTEAQKESKSPEKTSPNTAAEKNLNESNDLPEEKTNETERVVVTPLEKDSSAVNTSEIENVVVTPLKEVSPAVKTSETENVVVTPLEDDSPAVKTSDTENVVVTPLKEDSPAVEEGSVPVFRQSEETAAACEEQLKAKGSCLAEGGECADLIKGYLQCIEAETTTE